MIACVSELRDDRVITRLGTALQVQNYSVAGDHSVLAAMLFNLLVLSLVVRHAYADSFEYVTMASLPDHRIRMRRLDSPCDPAAKQYTGYLDISEDKHLFFWFFESRRNPHKAPLATWLSGGPGGSSIIGLLFENGPCTIMSANSTSWNPYSWNEVSNIIYLDQPAGTGYSYSTSPHTIDNSQEAAKDFYAFMQLFLQQFPQYVDRPFHVLSESHGGQYATNFASYINHQNKVLAQEHQHVNLESIMIVNGLVNAAIQDETPPDEHCKMLQSRIPRFRELFRQCRDFKTPLTCVPAMIYRSIGLQEGFEKTGLNRFDVRKSCVGITNCYNEVGWAQSYLNSSETKAALGIPAEVNYRWINMDISRAFTRAGDDSYDAMPAVRELIEDGIRVLNLAGDTDFASNFIGAFQWMYRLDSAYTKEFQNMNNIIWKLNGRAVGEVRAAGDLGARTAGKFTWLRVYKAGHWVAYDQPEVALEIFKRVPDDLKLRLNCAITWLSSMVSFSLAVIPLVASYAWALAIEQVPLDHSISTKYPGGPGLTVAVDGDFEHITTASLPNYRMRVRQSSNLCDPTVKQYSGYLDVSKDKHLFFWFFESRNDPHKAPLAAWMNGGPGGSSALGLLMENGPCNVISNNASARNPYAWNEVANMFFLDQPAGVGYSYSTSDHLVDTTWEAAKDFYAFMQLFLKRFPQYSKQPFHVLSESYGGQYAPNFANYINRQNKANRALVNPKHQYINLESVLIVNGMVSVPIQAETIPEYACAGPYAFWDNNSPHCKMLRSRIPRLRQLFERCKDFDTPLTCVPAAIFAFAAMDEGFENMGLNRYDIRRPCSEEVACYDEMEYAQAYLNRSDVKVALGVPANYSYSWLNMDINLAFARAGDTSHDASPMVQELLEDGVRVLNLAGDADFACNFIGAFKWMYRLDSKYAKEFRSLNNTVWKLNGKPVGEVRASADEGGRTAGKFTWLRVYEAGHMVPHDQPEVALEFFRKWINNKPLAE
ncbi:unnamed protein product [Rhizoctonia solani]|uniref:Carboxypeptidase n=1 Tax=Rhizoctonia solani TaxID=456999 RepID=A0A8H3GH63_9AGAM|nr:unnamed protein product [Rhizoctonia solani]